LLKRPVDRLSAYAIAIGSPCPPLVGRFSFSASKMMIQTLFPDDEPLEPLTLRIMRFFERYKASIPAALGNAVLNPSQRSLQGRQEVQEAVLELLNRGQLVRLVGDSVFAKNVLHLPGHDVKITDITRVWWCCMEAEQRHLVTYSELKALFAAEDLEPPFHNYSHALYRAPGGPVLTRIYQCNAEKKNAREQIRRHVTENSKKFVHWLDEGSYRLAVLVRSPQRKLEIEKLITERYRSAPALAETAGITVSVVPTEQTFANMLKLYQEDICHED